MKIYLSLFIIFLCAISSGCANDGFYKAVYDAFDSDYDVKESRHDPAENINREKKSYNAYKREREEVLKEGEITQEQIDFFKKQDISDENLVDVIKGDNNITDNNDKKILPSSTEEDDN